MPILVQRLTIRPKLSNSPLFPDTRWSLVIDAQGGDADTRAQRAIGELCQSYWYPLYAYLRGSGLSPQDAEDRTQAFFANVLAHRSLDAVSPERGKLRAFLKAALRNFNNNEWRRDYAQKRGGGEVHLSIDQDWAEERLAAEPDTDPLDSFDRHWAFSLLKTVFKRLEDHHDRTGKRELYDAIKGCLQGDGKYEAGETIAVRLGISHEGVRSAVFKLRRRFRDYVHEEIAETCASPDEAKEEIAYLCRILTSET